MWGILKRSHAGKGGGVLMGIHIYLWIGLAVVVVAGGVFFIRRRLRTESSEELAVPISSVEEIKNLKKAFSSDMLSDDKETSLTQHILKENLRAGILKSADGQNTNKDVHSVKESIENQTWSQASNGSDEFSRCVALEKECERLKIALEREISSKESGMILSENTERLENLNQALDRSKDTVTVLTEENQQLKLNMTDLKEEYKNIEQALVFYKKKYDDFFVNNTQLLDELCGRLDRTEKQAMELLMGSKKEVVLSDQEKQHLRDESMRLHEQEKLFRSQINILKEKNHSLTEEIAKLHSELPQQYSKVEKEMVAQVEQLQKDLEILENEKSEILKFQKKLQSDYDQIQSLNAQLVEKGKLLQYELTKHRAQALGLEKICADFRFQMEQPAGKNSSAGSVI